MLGAIAFAVLPGKAPPIAKASPCDRSPCKNAQCGAGFQPQASVDGCCTICVAQAPHTAPSGGCADARCPACPAGTREQPIADQCCPTCIAADGEACKRGLSQYDTRRAQLEDELRACKSSEDCTVASFSDACRASCPLALNRELLGSVVSRLREEASVYCEACAAPPFECTEETSTKAVCTKGRCELDHR
jgi:hypothetical protein